MKTKKLSCLLLWGGLSLCQAQAQICYLHSDTQGVEWTVVAKDKVGTNMTDFLPLMQEGYQHPEAVKAVVPGTVFTSFVEAGKEKDPNFGLIDLSHF